MCHLLKSVQVTITAAATIAAAVMVQPDCYLECSDGIQNDDANPAIIKRGGST